jgi:hypothetical protein
VAENTHEKIIFSFWHSVCIKRRRNTNKAMTAGTEWYPASMAKAPAADF